MHDELAARIAALAADYVALVDTMRGGQYADEDEYRTLSSQRTVVHDELIRLTGLEERPAMYGYCRDLLAGRSRAV
jgi:hypothetical protein